MTDQNTVPENEAAKEHRRTHWNIDNEGGDGQFKAGEVDKEQEEFLKNTEMID